MSLFQTGDNFYNIFSEFLSKAQLYNWPNNIGFYRLNKLAAFVYLIDIESITLRDKLAGLWTLNFSKT